jgi:hypothetical protein
MTDAEKVARYEAALERIAGECENIAPGHPGYPCHTCGACIAREALAAAQEGTNEQ